jgi:hypothetical protein
MISARSDLPLFTALWLFAAPTIGWPIDSERVEGQLIALAASIDATLQANYRYEDALLEWRLEQTFRRGSDPCTGETLLHEIVRPTDPGAEKLWDRHVTRRFSFSDVTMIVTKPGVRPLLYTLPGEPAELERGSIAAYTITISTTGSDFEIEFYGFDGGEAVPKQAPLNFTSYYHDLFVSSYFDATGAAAQLKDLAEECGSRVVEILDLGG